MVRLSARQLLMLRLLVEHPNLSVDQLEVEVRDSFRTCRSLARLGLAETGPRGWRATDEGRQALAAKQGP